MKKKKLLLMILCGVLCAFLAACKGKDQKKEEQETTEAAKTGDMENEEKTEIETINLSSLTALEVITDCTKFIPVTQDQSYHLETDANPIYVSLYYRWNTNTFLDLGDIIYMSLSRSGLFTADHVQLAAVVCGASAEAGL